MQRTDRRRTAEPVVKHIEQPIHLSMKRKEWMSKVALHETI
jgi:hypothetical protein